MSYPVRLIHADETTEVIEWPPWSPITELIEYNGRPYRQFAIIDGCLTYEEYTPRECV